MNFGQNILKKFGWKEGNGLGKNNDGISKPIKVALKNDQIGLGYDKFGYAEVNWWENVYDNASNNLKIHDNNNNNHEVTFSTVKTITKTADFNTKNSSSSNNLKFEKLFESCEGRTAHKGARFGLKMNGKLKRIAEQDALFKKRLLEKDLTNKDIQESTNLLCPDVDDNSPMEPNITRIKKNNKKSKKRKYKELINDNDNINVAEDVSLLQIESKKRKKNKERQKSPSSEPNGEASYEISQQSIKKLKKRKKSKNIIDTC